MRRNFVGEYVEARVSYTKRVGEPRGYTLPGTSVGEMLITMKILEEIRGRIVALIGDHVLHFVGVEMH